MENKNSYKKGGMFEGALHTVSENVKAIRNNMTVAETVLWMYLKEGVSSCKFRRQHPIGMYIADFYCHKAKLVIEIDGSIHHLQLRKKNDEEKENFLLTAGCRILRFTNDEVMESCENVLQKISTVVSINIRKHAPNFGG